VIDKDKNNRMPVPGCLLLGRLVSLWRRDRFTKTVDIIDPNNAISASAILIQMGLQSTARFSIR